MSRFNLKTSATALALIVTQAAGAYAADGGRAWGTIGVPGQTFLNSVQMHQSSGAVALQDAQGREGPFKNVTSCGSCTNITITGDNNSINGNTITNHNFGDVTSKGWFYGW